MLLWISALLLLAVLGLVGYYQGAIRAGSSLIGLLVAAVLAIPLAFLARPILRLFGLAHPVLLDFLAPFTVFLVLLVAAKVGALALHRRIGTYYKYKTSDTQRLLFERLNERVGICFGLANGVVYVFLIGTVAYLLGYFTIQAATSDNDRFALRVFNNLVQEMQDNRFDKAVAPLVPASEDYYDALDILGDVYHNPLLQSRLSTYPVFLTLAEQGEFKTLANDVEFQQFWLQQPRPTFGELINHEKIRPLIENADLFTNVLGMIRADLKDLKTYVETGRSPRYDPEKILGRWDYSYPDSLARARRAKPNMSLAEGRYVRKLLSEWTNLTFTATIDHRLLLKDPGELVVRRGTWSSSGNGYQVSVSEGGRKLEGSAQVEGSRLIIQRDGFALVFEK